MEATATEAAARFELGSALRPMRRVHGGLLNRMWRLDTDAGSFAVKELNLERDWPCDFDAILAIEQAAHRVGLSLPRPVPDPHTGRAVVQIGAQSVVVHEWVEGMSVSAPVAPDFASALGRELGVLHRLGLEGPAPHAVPMPAGDDWTRLAERAFAAGVAWAAQVTGAIAALTEVGRLVDEWNCEPGDVVVSHRDVGPKNLLDRDGTPVLLDWEAAGPVPVAHELGHAVLGVAVAPGTTAVDDAAAAAFFAGYRSGGGRVPPAGPHWLSTVFSSWAHFLRWNIERALGGDVSSGPSLTTAETVIVDGLAELPRLLGALPRITATLERATRA